MELQPATTAAAATAEQLVCQALRGATDPNHEVVKKCEAELNNWELQAGFFPTLVRIFQNQQLDVNTRWMAAVYMKNGINKYWRRNMKHELSANEKQEIRQLLMSNFNEPVPQVANQIAVLISKIARIDCPRDWPELVPTLLERVQTTDELELQRVLLVLYQVIKALSSKRMMADKRMFEELTSGIYGYIYGLWDNCTNQFYLQLQGNSTPEQATNMLERALLALRILRKLSIYGWQKPQLSSKCMHFIEVIFPSIRQSLQCRFELLRLQAHANFVALIEKFILKHMKILNEFQNAHPSAFENFNLTALEFAFQHVFHEGVQLIFSNNEINFRQFAIHCMNLMKSILLSERSAVLTQFFTPERVNYIYEKLIAHYMLLSTEELDMWADDPEGFSLDSGGDSWKYSLRPSVETLFVTLMVPFQKEWSGEVLKYVQKAKLMQLSESSPLKDILLKDAIYNAVGLSSFHLYELDLQGWFTSYLVAELKMPSEQFRILRRRIIWMVSQWTCIKMSPEMRSVVYEACLHLLRSDEDMSVRLAASKALYKLIDDFDFAPEYFLPFLPASFNALFVLLQEAKECDTKMNVLTSMSMIVDKMSDHIEPEAGKLISYLPMLWEESEGYNMLRCAIIGTLQELMKPVHDIPEPMTPFLYGVIELSTNLENPAHIYLMEDGLALFLAVLENSKELTPKLFELAQVLLPIIEKSTENMRLVLLIIQAYILLDARTYLERYGRVFIEFCLRMYDDLRAEGIAMTLKVFETCLKSEPQLALELLRPALPYIFTQICENKDFPMLMSMYFTIFARVLLIDQNVFMSVVQGLQHPNALYTLLEVVVLKLPLVSELEKKKLICLAFCSIFSNNAIVLEHFPHMLQNIAETLTELMEPEQEAEDDEADEQIAGATTAQALAQKAPVKYTDSLVFIEEHDFDDNYHKLSDIDCNSHQYSRCRQLSLKDAVHKIVLPECVAWHLKGLHAQMGNEHYQQLMRTVEASTLLKLSEYVPLGIDFPLTISAEP